MTSLRHNSYLDAAREAILDVGWRRTTLTDVARRAGVSRMTIYRAWPDMESLLADLMTREWTEMAAATPGDTDRVTPESIADAIVALVATLRANALFRRILDVDPEMLLPYLLQRRGRSQQAVLDILLDRISAGQAAGTVTSGDPETLARTVLLASHGLALSTQTMTDNRISEKAIDATFADLVSKGLRP